MAENRETENQVTVISTEEELDEIFAKIFEDAFQAQNPEGKSRRRKPAPTQKWCWWGGSLKNRPCVYTYLKYKYSQVPPNITIPAELAEIKTLEDLEVALPALKENLNLAFLFLSPTCCYFDISKTDPGLFYRDQQDCVLWYLDENTGYVMDHRGNYVAKSLSEFLSRICLENACWFFSEGKDTSYCKRITKGLSEKILNSSSEELFSPSLKREIRAYEQFYKNKSVRS